MNAPGGPAIGEVTKILRAIRAGEAQASDTLIRLVYAELRQLAAARMRREPAGHTLQATALVHEAWLRLGDAEFSNRAHFFAAAGEAMRRILVERARSKLCEKRGAGAEHVALDGLEIAGGQASEEEALAVHEALDRLAEEHPRTAELVKLRYFVGLTFEEAADVLEISIPTAKRDWSYARAWLHQEISRE